MLYGYNSYAMFLGDDRPSARYSSEECINISELMRIVFHLNMSCLSCGVSLLALPVDYFFLRKALKRYAHAHVDEQLKCAHQALELAVFETIESLRGQLQEMKPGQIAVRANSRNNKAYFVLKLQGEHCHAWKVDAANADSAGDNIFTTLQQRVEDSGKYTKLTCSSVLYHAIGSELKNLAYSQVLSGAELGSVLSALIGCSVACLIIGVHTPVLGALAAILILGFFISTGMLLGGLAGGCNASLPALVEAEKKPNGLMHRMFNCVMSGFDDEKNLTPSLS